MEWAIGEIIKNPEIMKRAQYEVTSIYNDKGNVDESRLHELKYLHASAPLLLPRECGQQCKINGYDIPAKADIIVNAWAIGRDPKYWIEAEKFNPSRFLDSEIDYKGNNFEYIPFGAGRRICPGASFSQAVVYLVLAQLLFHFDWKLLQSREASQASGELRLVRLDIEAHAMFGQFSTYNSFRNGMRGDGNVNVGQLKKDKD
ncbi:tabersonine 16-hydroxylase 2-like [Coffea eugenioides]|uniref:tabersonine 16-hydroxylase 2-like n=1 Tax=Coffea eugenioides TaxID=49369 RepID=UPI000F60AC56|nr:tabersonine 16-hydroxylase 2-like [Coffea eugenioides]